MAELDRLEARAWPPLQETRPGEWRLRFSSGVTGRANPVLPLGPDDWPPLGERIEAVERAYRERALPPKFQLTASAWPPGMTAPLRDWGMTAPLRDWHSSGTRLARAWHREWFEVYRAVDARDDDVVAVELGVLDGDWLAACCMTTLPRARRQGHARALLVR